ncbi:MAG: 3D domain-containing protein [Lachnospiraceae bacterium]|nr:3D domain-containing protein [Lachnospiraceae bacterium]
MKHIQKKCLLVLLMLSIVLGGSILPAKDTQAATKKVYLGKYTLTAYCPCKKCSGKFGKKTASGTKPKQGRTIAVDRKKIKLGTKIHINGTTYTAEDTGGAIKGNRIDIYFNSHKKALKFGKKKKVKVYKVVKTSSKKETAKADSSNDVIAVTSDITTDIQADTESLKTISNDAVATADNIVASVTQ